MAHWPAGGPKTEQAVRANEPPPAGPQRRWPPRLAAVSLVAVGWGLLYALYRGYYGLGGTVGRFGTPSSEAQWRAINLAGAAVLLVVALLPVAALPLWRHPRWRRVLLVLCWVLAVGFVTHALVMDAQRVLSLAGVVHIRYPASLWVTVDTRAADIQDLAFNETWFLTEGLLWGSLALMTLGPSRARRWWTGTALAAIAVLTSIGMFSAVGLVGRVVVF